MVKKPSRGVPSTEKDPRFKALALLVEHIWQFNDPNTALLSNLEKQELLDARELVRSMVDG